jgi:hypothetical protein
MMKTRMENRGLKIKRRCSRFFRSFILDAPCSLALLFLALIACVAFADGFGNAKIKGTGVGPVVLEFHEPPFELVPKTVLRGASAEPLSSSHLILISNAVLQTLSTNGEVQTTIEAPEVLFNMATRVVSSTGKVEARNADGKQIHTGRGFLWQQTNSVFYITNVQSRLRETSTNSFFQ